MKTMMRKSYPTDLTDEEWSVLEPILRGALYGNKSKSRGHPRHYPLREIVNAIMYILKTGCQWRQLPHDLPPWKTVYYHFRRWRHRGIMERIGEVLVGQMRVRVGKGGPESALVDSQSVPSTSKGGFVAMTGVKK